MKKVLTTVAVIILIKFSLLAQSVTFTIDNFVGAPDNDSGTTSEIVGGVTYVLSFQIVPGSGNVLSDDIGGGDLLFFETAPAGVNCTITADGQPITFNLLQADVDAVGSSTYEWKNSDGNLIFSGTTVNGTVQTDIFSTNNMNITGFNVNASNDTPGWHNLVIDNITSLPVELISFSARASANTVALNWQTASEENNAGFEIEQSTDGKNFNSIGFEQGLGTTAEEQNYAFEDKAVRAGQVYYYRLKQIDYDGAFEYSNIVQAQIEGKSIKTSFFPNPSKGSTQLNLFALSKGQAVLNIYDASGKEILNTTYQVEEGENNISLDLTAFPKGIYFTKIILNDGLKYEKLVIE